MNQDTYHFAVLRMCCVRPSIHDVVYCG